MRADDVAVVKVRHSFRGQVSKRVATSRFAFGRAQPLLCHYCTFPIKMTGQSASTAPRSFSANRSIRSNTCRNSPHCLLGKLQLQPTGMAHQTPTANELAQQRATKSTVLSLKGRGYLVGGPGVESLTPFFWVGGSGVAARSSLWPHSKKATHSSLRL